MAKQTHNRLAGRWTIVSSPDLDDEYLDTLGAPFIELKVRRGFIDGSYQIGAQQGVIDGRPDGDRVLFAFEGNDADEVIRGAGTIDLEGETLKVRMLHFEGDEFSYECRRA